MKIYSLKYIRKFISNTKIKNEFSTYLSSLDFDEYNLLFRYYNSIFTRYIIKNKHKKSKIINKQYYLNIFMKKLYNNIFIMFYDVNISFFLKVKNNIDDENKKINYLYNKIIKDNNILKNIKNLTISMNNKLNYNDEIFLCSIFITKIYLTNELDSLIKELDSLIKENE